MKTTESLEAARTFLDLKSLVAEVNRLKDAGEIDGYAIRRNSKGYVMGVRVGSEWGPLL